MIISSEEPQKPDILDRGILEGIHGQQLPCGNVTRVPFYFPARSGALFAWLRFHRSGANRSHGIIICNPFGHEQIHAYRSLRHFAERLADDRFPVLTFDYQGAGDSLAGEEVPGRITAWSQDVEDAIRWMREALECRHITLVGFRLGATLATLAACREPVDSMVLWAPVVNGKQYARELKTLSATVGPSGILPAGQTDDIESGGFLIDGRTLREIQAFDLRSILPKAGEILIASRDDMPVDQRLAGHYSSGGSKCDQIVVTGFAEMVALPHFTQVPTQAINEIRRWIHDRSAETLVENFPSDSSLSSLESTASLPWNILSSNRSLSVCSRVVEKSVVMGTDPRLFGILSAPAAAFNNDAPVILLLNGGSAHRVGPNRMYVELTRRLSARGFRCLRMDLCGLGDSLAPDPESENKSYPSTALRDVEIAVNHVSQHLGIKRVVLLGLCSGGYNAFQAASRLATLPIVESIVINPLTFYWEEGMSYEVPQLREIRDLNYYFQMAFQPQKWLKLLSGRTQIGVGGAMRMAFSHWRALNRAESIRPGQGENTVPVRNHSNSHGETIPLDLARIASLGRKVSFYFSRSEPGYGLLKLAAKRTMRKLQRKGQLRVTFIEDGDHTFSTRGPRQQLIDAISNDLERHYGHGKSK